MKQQEEQLIQRYLQDKKKKRKILLLSFFLLFICIGTGLFIKTVFFNDDSPSVHVTKEADTTPPDLVLTEDKIEIEVGDTIVYESYIKSATDKKKDVRKNVIWNEIDTSKSGTYEILYEVMDSNRNKAQMKLVVIVKEKPIVEEEVTPTPQPVEEVTNSNNQNSTQNQNPPTPPIPSTVFPKFFSVQDYGNIDGAMNACYGVMGQFGGGCYPIRNQSNGEWLGYELRAN